MNIFPSTGTPLEGDPFPLDRYWTDTGCTIVVAHHEESVGWSLSLVHPDRWPTYAELEQAADQLFPRNIAWKLTQIGGDMSPHFVLIRETTADEWRAELTRLRGLGYHQPAQMYAELTANLEPGYVLELAQELSA